MDELQPILAVILVLSLLGVALVLLRRRGIASFRALPAVNQRQMKVVERVPLGAQHALHLVRVGDRLILVATAPEVVSGARCGNTGLGRGVMRRLIRIAVALSAFAGMVNAAARTAPATPSILPAMPKDLSTPMQIIILMTLLTLLPAIIMSVTPFLRISIVLHFLRQALGTQTAPSNQVLLALTLFLTMILVAPLSTQIYNEAWQPMEKWRSHPLRRGIRALSR